MNSQIQQKVLILFSSTLVMGPLFAKMMNSNLTKKSVDAFFRARRWLLYIVFGRTVFTLFNFYS